VVGIPSAAPLAIAASIEVVGARVNIGAGSVAVTVATPGVGGTAYT
jgi:hypothetical protein